MSVTNRFAGGDATPIEQGVVLWNGTGWDQWQNNVQGTLLASQVRSVQTDSPVVSNPNARGLMLFLNVTVASGTGGLSPLIMSVDPVSGASRQSNQNGLGPTITTGLSVFELYPGLPASSGATFARSNDLLPRVFFVRVVVGDASSYTYSLGYCLIV